jgi:hypothetical protein
MVLEIRVANADKKDQTAQNPAGMSATAWIERQSLMGILID